MEDRHYKVRCRVKFSMQKERVSLLTFSQLLGVAVQSISGVTYFEVGSQLAYIDVEIVNDDK